MILTGSEILKNYEEKRIIIDPFNRDQLNPNSYNFTLGNKLLVYNDYVLDVKKENPARELEIPEEGLTLAPGTVYLGHTKEVIGSEYFVPVIRGRSSIGRLGLFINITADLIDVGAIGQVTLQLNAVQPVTIYPGMQIGQVTFWAVSGDVKKYDGRYQNSMGPVASKMYEDFRK
ncbi:MAG: dCTP deaminase [Alphaproteobacteria bacterium]|nr:dCTP deaminase [Alphaproteobacteria bacterium]MBO7642141.1 dCTP deaminase [Alphaproteobacteria bacterium]